MRTLRTISQSGMIGMMLAVSLCAQPVPTKYPFPVGQLDLYPVYVTRTAAQAAGVMVGPYDPAKPIKQWVDPTGGSILYNVFDPSAASSGYVSQILVSPLDARNLNLPGAYVYPKFSPPPCVVTMSGPYGQVGAGDISSFAALAGDAQAMLNQIAPLYPGKALTLVEGEVGQYTFNYGTCASRDWVIMSGSANARVTIGNAEQLIAAQNANGVGVPGSWKILPLPSEPKYTVLTWVPMPQVTTAPAGAVTLPAPIRPLMPGESIQPITGVLPGSNAFQVINTSAQIALLEAQIAALQAQLAALQAQPISRLERYNGSLSMQSGSRITCPDTLPGCTTSAR